MRCRPPLFGRQRKRERGGGRRGRGVAFPPPHTVSPTDLFSNTPRKSTPLPRARARARAREPIFCPTIDYYPPRQDFLPSDPTGGPTQSTRESARPPFPSFLSRSLIVLPQFTKV